MSIKWIGVMRSFAVVCVLIAAVNAEKDAEEFAKYIVAKGAKVVQTCIAETRATEDDLKELQNPSRHEGMCMLFCLHRNFGMQEANGKLNIDGMMEWFSPLKEINEEVFGKTKNMVETCVAEISPDDDPCITANNFNSCTTKIAQEMGIDDYFKSKIVKIGTQ